MDWHRFANHEEDYERTSRIVRQLGDPDPHARKQAEALGALGGEAAIAMPQIVSLFQHPDHNVRRDAIMAVGRMGQSGLHAAPKLIESLADQDAGVRRMARIAILQVDPDAKALLGALTHSDLKIRESAAHALPRVVRLDPPPVDNLVAHLADDAPGVGQKIIETLVSIGSPAVPALTKSLGDARLSGAAVAVLAKIGKAAIPAIEPLTELARSQDAVSAVEAVRALGGIGLEAIPALVSLLDSGGRVSSTAMAMIAAMRVAAAPAIPSLTQLARQKNRPLAAEAVRTLGAIGPEAIPLLVSLLDEDDLDSLVVQPTERDHPAWTFGMRDASTRKNHPVRPPPS
jgi:HEAT repeat protein